MHHILLQGFSIRRANLMVSCSGIQFPTGFPPDSVKIGRSAKGSLHSCFTRKSIGIPQHGSFQVKITEIIVEGKVHILVTNFSLHDTRSINGDTGLQRGQSTNFRGDLFILHQGSVNVTIHPLFNSTSLVLIQPCLNCSIRDILFVHRVSLKEILS